jgi:hypothetical protein
MKVLQRVFIGVLLVSVLQSCGTDYLIDSRLQPYLNTFYSEAEKQGRTFDRDNLVLRIRKDLPYERGGQCIEKDRITGPDQIIIEIDQEFFDTSSPTLIESVVFHELGHGLLGRSHVTRVSFMHPAGLYFGQISPQGLPIRQDLINELFQASK